MAEVIKLADTARLTDALEKEYTKSLKGLEEIIAWLRAASYASENEPTIKRADGLAERFENVQSASEDMWALVLQAKETCQAQLLVADAVEHAGAMALDKQALQPRS